MNLKVSVPIPLFLFPILMHFIYVFCNGTLFFFVFCFLFFFVFCFCWSFRLNLLNLNCFVYLWQRLVVLNGRLYAWLNKKKISSIECIDLLDRGKFTTKLSLEPFQSSCYCPYKILVVKAISFIFLTIAKLVYSYFTMFLLLVFFNLLICSYIVLKILLFSKYKLYFYLSQK